MKPRVPPSVTKPPQHTQVIKHTKTYFQYSKYVWKILPLKWQKEIRSDVLKMVEAHVPERQSPAPCTCEQLCLCRAIRLRHHALDLAGTGLLYPKNSQTFTKEGWGDKRHMPSCTSLDGEGRGVPITTSLVSWAEIGQRCPLQKGNRVSEREVHGQTSHSLKLS